MLFHNWPVESDSPQPAVSPTGEEFGEARLAASLIRHRGLPATALRDALVSDVDTFAGAAPQHDDMTSILVRVIAA